MPLIALACAAYAAGLLIGFGGVIVPGLAAGGAAILAALWRRQALGAALAALATAGVLVAAGTARGDAHCRAAAARLTSWQGVVDDAAAPGAFIHAELAAGGCTVPAVLTVEHGRAAAGARVLITGTATADDRGLLLRDASLTILPGGSLLLRWRAHAGRAIDAVFGADAPLARALLIADQREIPPEMRDRFAAAGIVHMLSISGLHVALIAMAVQLLFQALRLPRPVVLVATIATTALYIAIIGAPPPALRSGAMLGVVAATQLAQRPTSPWAALALGAAIPLANPRTVLDLGFQLSVVGMAGLIASGALARRWIAPRLSGWRASLAGVALASVVATIVSAPLVTWYFGRLSLVAPVTNVLATPIIGLAQPALFLALLLAPIAPLAHWVADAVHPLLWCFQAIATAGAGVPHGTLTLAPTLTAAFLGGIATAALVAACTSDFPARPLAVAAGALTLGIWLPLAPLHSGELELHMIDVGQGDAIALRTPRGRWIVVDAGRVWRNGDAARSTVIPYLRRRGGDVVAFVLTHPHADHAGGAATLLRTVHPGSYWDGAYVGTSEPYRASLLAARGSGVAWRRVHPGDSTELDGVHLTVLAPDSAWMQGLADPNAASVVLLVRYGSVRFLLTGDAEADEEEWMLAHEREQLRADVLKVGHHGSRTSSTPAFLAAVRPRLALVSVGAGNSYGLPNADVLAALARSGAQVLRTDRAGSIIARTDGRRVTVEVEGETWALSAGSEPP